ncbi:MAG: hemerythrin family protein [Anaerolineales bacterium]|nr:hemerythrin family protein [Anaerolineales bacterium]
MTKKLFDFDDEFKLGIEAADIEHGKLIDMLNRTHELLSENKRDEARSYFSQTLAGYVHEHFSNEETFLESIQYPELEDHKKIHANFRKSFEELEPRIKTADDVAFRQALTDTFVWIINHIGKTDKKYAKYYLKQQAG